MSVAEGEKNSSRIAEIVLIVRAGERIAESGQDVVELGRTNCEVLAHRDVYSTAKVHGKRLGSGRFR